MGTQAVGFKIAKRYNAERGLLFNEDGSIVDCSEADAVAKTNGFQYAKKLVEAFDGKTIEVDEENHISINSIKSMICQQVATETDVSDIFGTQKTEKVSNASAEPDFSAMFGGEGSEYVTSRLDSMAQFAAVEEAQIAIFEEQIATRKANLDKIKEDMATIMLQNGMESVKLACGLNPKAEVKTKFFKAAGVDDDTLFDWLRSKSLGDIIKPHVAWQTLNSTMKAYREQGNDIPETVINATEYKTVRMNGKSKFLAARNAPESEESLSDRIKRFAPWEANKVITR